MKIYKHFGKKKNNNTDKIIANYKNEKKKSKSRNNDIEEKNSLKKREKGKTVKVISHAHKLCYFFLSDFFKRIQ